MIRIDSTFQWNRLGKRHINRTPFSHAHIKFTNNTTFQTAGIYTVSTASTFLQVDIPWFLLNFHFVVSNTPFNTNDLRICKQLYIWMICNLHHFGGKNTTRTIQCWKRLIKLSHPTTDTRRLFNKIDFMSFLG